MFLSTGTRLGPYEVLSAIGAGGMGEVYRARDTKLNRDVAIKILPELFAADPERVARFTREAKTLAALNHPHIAQIYGLEEAQGVSALVMELVEGPTLADRIAKGAIPLDEVLPIAKQIAEALETAHEAGIIHRDLKPANIKVREDGTVKVLDFGLAKALDPAGSGVDGAALTNSPTITSPAAMTQRGVILGTAAYMAPEQAKGRAVDKRADIWAFGCVLFEMLTGQRAFPGEDVSDTLARVLMKDPDWPALPADTPPSIRRLLRRCLEKERRKRLESIADARLEIEDALAGPSDQPAIAAVPARATRREYLAWSTAGLLAVVVALALARLAYLGRGSPAGEAPEMRLDIATPGGDLADFTMSPDGRALVYTATIENRTQLWLRRLDTEIARPLSETDGAILPFWSPDGQSIGFFTSGQVKRLDVGTGLVRTVAAAPFGVGGTWGSQERILFSPFQTSAVYRVDAAGSTAVEVTQLDPPRQVTHRLPCFLPDGRHFLFFVLGTRETKGVYLGSVDSTDTRRLFDADSQAVLSPPDRLVYAREGALLAQRLELKTLALVGAPLTVAAHVAMDLSRIGLAAMSASAAGPIAYRANPEERQLTWLDRAGRSVGTLGAADLSQPAGLRLSPDGHTLTYRRNLAGNDDVWLADTVRGVLTRFTMDPARDSNPIWSPDGSRIVFCSRRRGVMDLYEKPVSGRATETVLLASSESKNALDWTLDGRFILYASQSGQTGFDLWAMPLFGDRKPIAVAQTPFAEAAGRFAPDGRWVAHQSDESGRTEIYVQSFPEPSVKTQISTSGGTTPEWRGDGKELFYVSNDRVMAVPITLGTSKVEAGTPVALFPLAAGTSWTVSGDGQRFLVARQTKEASPITVLLNWNPEAKR
jgi:eukaryotic-like serine/threonine-protein kinase